MRCCDCTHSYNPMLRPYKTKIGGRYYCSCRMWKKPWWRMKYDTENNCKRFRAKLQYSFHDAMGFG